MTLKEAREILAQSPEWVRRVRCENVGHYIREYLDTGGEGVVHPSEPPMAIAGTILNDLNREAAATGEDPDPVSVEQLAAYLVVNTAERADRARQQRVANALMAQYHKAYEQAYDQQDPPLTVAEAARRLGISKKLVREHIKAGRLRAFRPGRAYKIRQSALEEFERATEVKVALCPACEERPIERGEALCRRCLESGKYLICPCGAWAAYDELRARHGDGLGGWIEDEEGRDRCPECAGEGDENA